MGSKGALGSNLSDVFDSGEDLANLKAENAELLARIEALTRENNTPLVYAQKAGTRPLMSRVRIVLQDSDEIAPSGQYFGWHGTWVDPDVLLSLEQQVRDGEITRREAQAMATEKLQFEAILRPGEEADVPVEMLGVLNDAVTSVAQVDPLTFQVTGYRDRLRFPYLIKPAARA